MINKNYLLIFFIILFNLSFFNALSFYEIESKKYADDELNTAFFSAIDSSILKSVYNKHNTIIFIYYPDMSSSKNKGKTLSQVTEEKFIGLGLDNVANPSRNIVFVSDRESKNIDIGYGENGNWNEEFLLNIFNKYEDLPIESMWLSMIEEIDNELNQSSLDVSYNLPVSQQVNCGYLIKNEGAKINFVVIFEDIEINQNNLIWTRDLILDLKDYNFWKSNFENFNFLYIKTSLSGVCTGSSLRENCHVSRNDFLKINYLLQSCPIPANNYIVISNHDFRSFAYPGKSVFISKNNLFNQTYTPASLLAHEIGHSFFCLRDEYVEPGKANLYGKPNCAPNLETARNWWGHLEGRSFFDMPVDYFQGCSYIAQNIRPTRNSVMHYGYRRKVLFFDSVIDYGKVNEEWMEKILRGEEKCS